MSKRLAAARHGQSASDRFTDHAEVYKRLKEMAIAYRFRPGEQIKIGELAERLRVSPTPLRETFIRLRAESHLDAAPRRGFFAKTLNLKEMADLVRFRFDLLKMAIEIVGKDRATISAVPPKDRANAGAGPNGTDEKQWCASEYVRWLDRTALQVASLAKNSVLVHALVNTHDRTHYVRSMDIEDAHRRRAVVANAEALLAALEHSEVATAIASLRRDRDDLLARMARLVKEGSDRAHAAASQLAPL